MLHRIKTFRVYVNPEKKDSLEDARFVTEGFSLFAFLIPLVWAIFRGAWLVLTILIIVNLVLAGLSSMNVFGENELMVLQLGIALYAGFEANDWYSWVLHKKGYKLEAIIMAKTLDEAQQTFFRGYSPSSFRVVDFNSSKISKYAAL